jgi:hypothetical protein
MKKARIDRLLRGLKPDQILYPFGEGKVAGVLVFKKLAAVLELLGRLGLEKERDRDLAFCEAHLSKTEGWSWCKTFTVLLNEKTSYVSYVFLRYSDRLGEISALAMVCVSPVGAEGIVEKEFKRMSENLFALLKSRSRLSFETSSASTYPKN